MALGSDHDRVRRVHLHHPHRHVRLPQPAVAQYHPDVEQQAVHQQLQRHHARVHGRVVPHDHQEHRRGGRQRFGRHSPHFGAVLVGAGTSYYYKLFSGFIYEGWVLQATFFPGLPMLLIALFGIVGGASVLFLPETGSAPLVDTIKGDEEVPTVRNSDPNETKRINNNC